MAHLQLQQLWRRCHAQQKKRENKTTSLRTRKQMVWKQDETIILTLLELSCPGGVKREVSGKKHEIQHFLYHCTPRGWDISLSSGLRYYLMYHGKATQLTSSLLGIGVGLHFTTVISAWLNVGRNILFLTKMGNTSWALKSSANCIWLLQKG